MLIEEIRKLIDRDPRSTREIAIAAEMQFTQLNNFLRVPGRGLSIESAERLAAVLGYEIQLVGVSDAGQKKAGRRLSRKGG